MKWLATRNGDPLCASSIEVAHAAIEKYYYYKELKEKEFLNPLNDPLFEAFFKGLVSYLDREALKNDTVKTKLSLYYEDIALMIQKTYEKNFIRNYDLKMGIFCRAWITYVF